MDSTRRQMGSMSAVQQEPFSIRRLDESCYWLCCPTPMMRPMVISFVFLTQGEILVEDAEGGKFFVHKNAMLLVPQGSAFSIRYYKEAVGYMGGFHSSFVNCDFFRAETLFASHPVHALLQVPLSESDVRMLDTLFARIVQEVAKEEVNRNLVKSFFVSCLFQLAGGISVSQAPLADSISNAFLEMIFDETKPLLSVKEYADTFSVTPNHLNKLIKNHTDKPVSAWIEESLIMRAKLLLLESDKTVAEVAECLNILDQSYFARKFKKVVGLSPLSYRMMNKKS